MSEKMAVIGDKDSIFAFKAVGVEVFGAADESEAKERLKALVKENYKVIFLTEDLAQALQYSDRVAVLAEGGLAAFDAPQALFAAGVLDKVFGVTLCRAPDGVYYPRRAAQRR